MLPILKILILDASAADVEKIKQVLINSGIHFEYELVNNKIDFINALTLFKPTLILSENNIPNFNSIQVIEHLKAANILLPYILVTTEINETLLVQIIKLGASGYVLKNNLLRLPIAVKNTIEISKQLEDKIKAKIELEKNETNYREMLQRITDSFAAIDSSLCYTYMNEKCSELMGCNPVEIIGKNIYKEFPEIIGQPFQIALDKAITTQQNINEEFFYEPFNKWLECRIYPNSHGTSIYFTDITERKIEREKLVKSVQRNIAFIAAIPDLIFIINKQGIFTDFHPAKNKTTLTQPENFLRKNIKEILPIELAIETIKNIEIALETGVSPKHRYQLNYPDGVHYFEARYAVVNETEVLIIVREITGEIEADNKLLKINEALEAAEELAKLGSWSFNLNTQERIWSKQMFRLFNLEPAATAISNEAFINYTHPNDRDLIFENIALLAKGILPPKTIYLTNPQVMPLKYFEPTFKIVTDENGNPYKFTGTLNDITEQIITENLLKENEAKYRTLIEQASDAILLVDDSLKYIEVNNAACKLFGFTKAELLNQTVNDFTVITKQDLPLQFDELKKGKSIMINRVFKHNDGTLIPIEISATMLPNGNFLAIVRDISERNKTEVLLQGENEVMEMIASGKPLKNILNKIAVNFEMLSNKAICSILLLDNDGLHLRHGAGPGLPDAYNNAIDGVTIGSMVGSCGTAAFTKERVIVSDIANDPLWINFRDLALGFNLKACWSTPILNNQNNVLGTFAIYYNEIRTPVPEEIILIDRSAKLVKLALVHFNNELILKDSEERYRTLAEAIPDYIMRYDKEGRHTYMNQAALDISGLKRSDVIGKSHLEAGFDAEQAAFWEEKINNVFKTGISFQEQFAWESAKGKIYLDWRLSPEMDENGNVKSVLGVSRDITVLKIAEENIRKLNEELEQKVKERTAELQTANFELKEIVDLFVGREQKIIELKKELAKVKLSIK